MPLSKNFCYAPWVAVEIMQNGSILPCCKFIDKHYDRQYNITTDSLTDYQNSQYLSQIKQELLDGQWPQGCESCKLEEQSQTKSKRQLDYVRWQEHYDAYQLDSGEYLRLGIAFGNTCNLKCIICNPFSSSLWQKEYTDLYGIKIPILRNFHKSIIESITSIAPNLIHIDIFGGEPFLSEIDEHKKLLNHYISTGRAKGITIHYTTNGTLFPSDDWFDLWQHFKEVDLQISIDGIGKRFEYLRFPAEWAVLENNVKKYLKYQNKNFRLSVAHTVSAFNVYYLDEFFSWCQEIGLPKPWIGRVHAPSHLHYNVWPKSTRLEIAKHLLKSKWPEVKLWSKIVQESGPDLFEKFQAFVKRHDNYRKLDYQKIFPEMAQYL